MKYSTVPKEYNYDNKFMGNNEAILNYEKEINNIKKINTNLLIRYRTLFESKDMFKQLVEPNIIINDINKFLYELNIAKETINKTIYRLLKGDKGENKVNNILTTLNNEYTCLRDITINIDGNKIENDFILIGKVGVISIEVKNIGNRNETLSIDKLGRVKRTNKKGEIIETYDMIEQSNRHCMLLNRLLRDSLSDSIDIPLYNYIVIASDINVINKSDFNILGPNQILQELNKIPACLTDENILNIQELICNNTTEGTKYPYYIYDEILIYNYKLILKSIQQLIN